MKNKQNETKYSMLVLTVLLMVVLAILCFVVYWSESSRNNSIETPGNIDVYDESNLVTVTPIVIADFSTPIIDGDNNRTHNIKLACQYLNNIVIKKGEEFSFNNTLAPYSEQKGYLESTGFSGDGHIIAIIGGGICQVSTTLYNTALIANLPIIERYAHSLPVDYIEDGKDATIAYPNNDLKFKNNKDFDILISSYIQNGRVNVTLKRNQ